MPVIDAVFANGAFRPLGPVSLPENQRVQLTVEPATAELPPPGPQPKRTPAEIQAALDRMAELTAFRERMATELGVMPDSTPLIRAMRYGYDMTTVGTPATLPPPGERPPRTPEQAQAALAWAADAAALRARQEAEFGVTPDSTPDIAADRRRHD